MKIFLRENKLRRAELNTKLIMAVNKHDIEESKKYLELGADVHKKSDFLLSNAASYQGDLKLVQLLVAYGANIHANKENALMSAIYHNRPNIVRYLVMQGANIHTNNNQAIKDAVRYNRLDIMKYLATQNSFMHQSL